MKESRGRHNEQSFAFIEIEMTPPPWIELNKMVAVIELITIWLPTLCPVVVSSGDEMRVGQEELQEDVDAQQQCRPFMAGFNFHSSTLAFHIDGETLLWSYSSARGH